MEGVGIEWRKMVESKLQKACGSEWMSELEKKEGSSDGEEGNCSPIPGLHRAQTERQRWMKRWSIMVFRLDVIRSLDLFICADLKAGVEFGFHT